ncbi:MAG: hypothetical protein AAF637_13360, partial [Pseudomonadota bacterium]
MLQVARGTARPTILTWLSGSTLRVMLTAWAAGAMTALALPPLHVWPGLLGFALLLYLLRQVERRRSALALGWCFGFGY